MYKVAYFCTREELSFQCFNDLYSPNRMQDQNDPVCSLFETHARVERFSWNTDDVLLLNGQNIFGQVQTDIERLLVTILKQVSPSLRLKEPKTRRRL